MVGEKYSSLSPRNADVVQVAQADGEQRAREQLTSHSVPLCRLAFVMVYFIFEAKGRKKLKSGIQCIEDQQLKLLTTTILLWKITFCAENGFSVGML